MRPSPSLWVYFFFLNIVFPSQSFERESILADAHGVNNYLRFPYRTQSSVSKLFRKFYGSLRTWCKCDNRGTSSNTLLNVGFRLNFFRENVNGFCVSECHFCVWLGVFLALDTVWVLAMSIVYSSWHFVTYSFLITRWLLGVTLSARLQSKFITLILFAIREFAFSASDYFRSM